jgi:hypothetical protein
VSGQGGVPNSGATAVSLNVTVTGTEAPDSGGYVTVYPCGTRPDASSLNFVNGQTIANAVTTPVGDGGQICFYVFGRAHLLVDVNGYYASAAAGPQGPTGPQGATGPTGPQGLAGSGGGASEFYYSDTGLMYMDPYTYDYWYLYCPSGTVAISGNQSVLGWPSAVKLSDTSALIYTTNDSSYSTSTAFGQLTCSSYSISARTTSSLNRKSNPENQSDTNGIESMQSALAELILRSTEAGFTRNTAASK